MTDRRTKAEWRGLLEQRIEESGLKTGEFAVGCLVREPRTVRRWLDGSSPIPSRVRDWLEDPKVAPWPTNTDEEV